MVCSGPLHGGANEAVIRMLVSIGRYLHDISLSTTARANAYFLSPENVSEFLAAVKRREKVLSGFGHRVYKTVRVPSHLPGKTSWLKTLPDSLTRGLSSLERSQMKYLQCTS